MTHVHGLADLATALTLPVHPPAGLLVAPHVIFRGPLMAFHFLLDARNVAHEVTVDPGEGYAVRIAGLVVERGGMGGVVVWEAVASA